MKSQNHLFRSAGRILTHFKRYPHFLIIGTISYGINISLTFLLTEYLRWWYLVSFITAALISLTFSFVLNSIFTFKEYLRRNHAQRYLLYIGFYIISAVITFILVYIFTSIIGLHYLVSITIVTATSSVVTFIVNKKFIFLDTRS